MVFNSAEGQQLISTESLGSVMSQFHGFLRPKGVVKLVLSPIFHYGKFRLGSGRGTLYGNLTTAIKAGLPGRRLLQRYVTGNTQTSPIRTLNVVEWFIPPDKLGRPSQTRHDSKTNTQKCYKVLTLLHQEK